MTTTLRRTTLRDELTSSFSKFRTLVITGVELVLDVLALPLKCIDAGILAFGPKYRTKAEAEPEVQIKELHAAAADVGSAAVNILTTGAATVLSICNAIKHSRPAQFLANQESISTVLSTGFTLLFEKVVQSQPPVITISPFMTNILVTLFVTGLLFQVVKRGGALLEACGQMGTALKRLLRALVALAGYYSVSPDPEPVPLLMHIKPA